MTAVHNKKCRPSKPSAPLDLTAYSAVQFASIAKSPVENNKDGPVSLLTALPLRLALSHAVPITPKLAKDLLRPCETP